MDGLTPENLQYLWPVLVLIVTVGVILVGALLGKEGSGRRGLLAAALAGLAIAVLLALRLNPQSALRNPQSAGWLSHYLFLDPLYRFVIVLPLCLPGRRPASLGLAVAQVHLGVAGIPVHAHGQPDRDDPAGLRAAPDLPGHRLRDGLSAFVCPGGFSTLQQQVGRRGGQVRHLRRRLFRPDDLRHLAALRRDRHVRLGAGRAATRRARAISPLAVVALVCLFIGLAFKISLVADALLVPGRL